MSIYIPKIFLNYFSAAVWALWIFSIVSFLEYLLRKFALFFTKKTKTELDDLILDILFSAFTTAKYVVVFVIAWQIVVAPEWLDTLIWQISSVSFLIILLVFFTNFVNLLFTEKFIKQSKMKAMSRTLLPFVRKTIIALIWWVWAITVIANLGYDVSALITGAWVAGIAVALAAQKSVSNIFGAITILMNKPFMLWDYITINGTTGTVKDIGLSYITLTDRNGHQVMIPNESFISASIENESKREYRRADFALGLIYDTTLTQVQKGVNIVEEILQKYVDSEKLTNFRVNFEAFWDFSLNINVTYFSKTFNYTDFVKEKEEINLEIKKSFAKAKLEMAFPTQEMIIKWGDLK